MQAIEVKYIGPTNTKPSRLKASCAAGSVTISYPYDLSGDALFRSAADALCAKLGWTDDAYPTLYGGQLANGNYVFVFGPKL